MTGNEYQLLASRTISDDLKMSEIEAHALHGMVGEVGEIHSLYQKVFQGREMDEAHLMKEVGDALWFISELITAKGWTMEEVMKLNIEKLKKRYPEGFDAEHSLNRAEGDI